MAVSVVLNGTGRKRITVSPEKAERIRDAARELRYQPNRLARALRNQRTNQVALVFQHFFTLGPENPYHLQVFGSVIKTLFSGGYAMTLCPKLNVDGDAGSISDGRFDGVLWCRPDFTESSIESIRNATTPVVMMHVPPSMAQGVPTFCANNEGAMRLVVDHLVSLGHRSIGYLIDPVSIHTVEGNVRWEAFQNAMQAADLPKPDLIVALPEDKELLRYATKERPHTALVCFSDEMAGFLLARLEQLGVSVPDHLSVVGFDSSPFCETTKPRLTSVSQPVARMAQEATDHLLRLIHEAEEGLPRSPMASCTYDCGLDIRESTASPCTH